MHRTLLALVLGLAGSSCKPEAPRAVVAPSAEGPTSAPGDVPTAAAASPPAPEQAASVEEMLATVADKSLYPIPLAEAAQRLVLFGDLRKEQVVPDVMLLKAARGGAELELSYQPAESGAWEFSALRLLLPATDSIQNTHRRAMGVLQPRLGKPLWTRKDKGTVVPQVGWKLARGRELWLGQAADGLEVSVATPEPHPG